MVMASSARCFAMKAVLAALISNQIVGARGHVFLMQPISRNFYYSAAFQTWDFSEITYCPHCYQSRGRDAVRERGGGGVWPLLEPYEQGELAENGNFLESDATSARHGICGDPEQTASESSNRFGKENSIYPVLETYQEGSIIEMKVIVSTYHWGHLEYFICNSEDLSDPEGGPVTQGCFNMHPLTRAEDDGDASPIDPNHPGRYHLDPPCREAETDQTQVENANAGYVATGRYQLPEGLTCERCIIQMVYYTGNACTIPGYEDFNPESVPAGCASSAGDWVTLDPPPCGVGDAYPEEFWNCADISITSDGVPTTDDNISEDDDDQPTPTPEPTPEPTPPIGTPSPITASPMTPSPETNPPATPTTPAPTETGGEDDDEGNDDDDGCSSPLKAWEQCGGSNWTGTSCCRSGYECVALSDDYAQCRPMPRDDDGCAYFWEQCGGVDWSGSTCCATGSECVRRDDWYSQCVP